MCARYSLHSPLDRLQDVFGFTDAPPLEPRYNIAPSQEVLAVRLAVDGEREAVLLKWGVSVPHVAAPLVNARSETAAEKPAFRDAFRTRRCLVLADGFYEWRHEGAAKQPFFIAAPDHEPLGLAALYEPERGPQAPATCVILTTRSNETVAVLHDRMPVIVPREHQAAWLDPSTPRAQLEPLLEPLPADRVEVRAVSTRVNNVKNDGPDLLEPPAQQSLF